MTYTVSDALPRRLLRGPKPDSPIARRRIASTLYSPSRLSCFEDCPKRFQYRYVLRIPAESESIEAFVGKRVHEVLERLHEAAGEGRLPTLPAVLNRYRLMWEEAYDPQRIRIVRSEQSVSDYRELGERCLTNYYRRFYPFDHDETLGLEERVTFSLDGDGAYRIQGIVDRIARTRDGTIEIQDYKTSQRVPRQRFLDRDRQLALYQLGVAVHYGEHHPVRLVWHYVAVNQVRSSTRSAEALADLRRNTMSLIDRIRAERDFAPRPGPLCRWCEYGHLCEANPYRAAGTKPAAPPEPPPLTPPPPANGQLRLL